MYVCLMRHGKAEPYTAGCDDGARKLVDKGKKQVAAVAETAPIWWPAGKTVIWTSPYIRARQTAEYMYQSISCTEMHTHEAIASGNWDAVYRQILCPAAADTICIVGHSPYLDQWASRWTGSTLEFKTGSIALFSYDPYAGAAGGGKLLLYLHPETAKQMYGNCKKEGFI
ncbi:histidine phosphatase family protein [uncultured Megasphaera sp.]|uniref:SixA phosphatase family protein n=1 Tax=uncultured Megasphaera sp. TaxID=165188 RepID=UPI002657BA4B|nr:histidine phosphatase family protein [uncultured Megasphaera sp.]